MAASRRRRVPRPRAAWFASEIPLPLNAAARRGLIAANKRFEVADWLDNLERELVVLVAEPRRLDISSKARRAELVELEQITQQLHAVLASLHPRSRDTLTGALALRRRPDLIRRLRKDLGVLRTVCVEVRAEIPVAGRPKQARRDAVIRAVCGFVDSLEPNRAEVVRRHGRAARDPMDIPLVAGGDDLQDRRLASVKIVCEAVKLPLGVGAASIVRKALSEEST
jgi:hypothetical protein